MTSHKITQTKPKPAGFHLKPIVVFLGIFLGAIGLVLTIYIGYSTSISEQKIFSISLLALFAGLLFESFLVSDKWENVVYTFFGAYVLSLLHFLPHRGDEIYNFEEHIKLWPYFFIFCFTLAFLYINQEKIITQLNEGITLLLSLSLIYWLIDYGFANYQNWFIIVILTIILILSIFSILNALTNIQLSRTTRLVLSVWSTIIMVIFAIENIITVFTNQDIESSKYLSQGIYIGLQYFFLGISAVYIMQNFLFLAVFFPHTRGTYFNDLKEGIGSHIDRYSYKQIFIGHSLFCILYAGLIFGLNYKYQVLPRNTMIWFVFLSNPLILQLKDLINERKHLKSL